MAKSAVDQLLNGWGDGKPISSDALARFLESIGNAPLPTDYVTFLLRHNGGEGHIGESRMRLRFQPIEELLRATAKENGNGHAPELVPFASAGGDDLLAFDLKQRKPRIVLVSRSNPRRREPLGGTLEEAMRRLAVLDKGLRSTEQALRHAADALHGASLLELRRGFYREKIAGVEGQEARLARQALETVGGWRPYRQRRQKKKQVDVPFVPTPQNVVERMLKLARVKRRDLVYDLGCGDGRIVITAAKKYGARAIGFDIDPQRLEDSRQNVRAAGVADRVRIRKCDLFRINLRPAKVITMYLLSQVNHRLLPKLLELPRGVRIVSHAFDLFPYKPAKEVTITGEYDMNYTLYLWVTPLVKVPEMDYLSGLGGGLFKLP